jgi:hypothetical protein
MSRLLTFSRLRNSYNYDIFTFAATLIERMPSHADPYLPAVARANLADRIFSFRELASVAFHQPRL